MVKLKEYRKYSLKRHLSLNVDNLSLLKRGDVVYVILVRSVCYDKCVPYVLSNL